MAKVTDDPKVQALVAKEAAKATKAERTRLLGVLKEHQTETLNDPLLDPAVKKAYKRLSTAAMAAAKKAPEEV